MSFKLQSSEVIMHVKLVPFNQKEYKAHFRTFHYRNNIYRYLRETYVKHLALSLYNHYRFKYY